MTECGSEKGDSQVSESFEVGGKGDATPLDSPRLALSNDGDSVGSQSLKGSGEKPITPKTDLPSESERSTVIPKGAKVPSVAKSATKKDAKSQWSSFRGFDTFAPSTTNQKNVLVLYTRKPRDENGIPLYSSDESSGDEFFIKKSEESDLQISQKAELQEAVENSVALPAFESMVNLGGDDEEELLAALGCSALAPLKYTAFFSCIAVQLGELVRVKRSDEDTSFTNWPLFFVQLEKNELYDILEEYLDNIESTVPLPEHLIAVGTLCAAKCAAFNAMYRAVITDVDNDSVSVHFVDYGNYEVVSRECLRSIEDERDMTRTHAAMAIPCILKEVHEGGDAVEEEETKVLKSRVSCDLPSFRLRFIRVRPDGVYVVESDS